MCVGVIRYFTCLKFSEGINPANDQQRNMGVVVFLYSASLKFYGGFNHASDQQPAFLGCSGNTVLNLSQVVQRCK